MRISHIEVCNAVLQTGNVTAAARMLHLSQPAVSKLLQSAERHLGFRLFTRQHNRLVPTEEALTLQPEFARLYSQIRRLEEMSSAMGSAATSTLRIDCVPSLAMSVMPLALKRFLDRLPKVACHVETHAFDSIVERLLMRKTDVGVAFTSGANPALAEEAVTTGEVVCAAPVGTFSREKQAVTWRDLDACRVIDVPDNDLFGHLFFKPAREGGAARQSGLTVETQALALKLAEQGVGVALVDSFTASRADPERVRLLPLQPSLAVEMKLLQPIQSRRTDAVHKFMHALEEAAHSIKA